MTALQSKGQPRLVYVLRMKSIYKRASDAQMSKMYIQGSWLVSLAPAMDCIRSDARLMYSGRLAIYRLIINGALLLITLAVDLR